MAVAPLNSTGRSDAELVAAVRLDGDERAFRELYRRHTPRLHQLVLRLLGGAAQDAEDVVQETWVRATSALERFRWDSSFSTWLTGIGINRARDLLRQHARRPGDHEAGDPTVLLEQLCERPRSVGERIDLERALAMLPEGYRVVFVLHDVEGFGHAEIGQQLGISEGTSKSQLFHARRALRSLLEPAPQREVNHA